MTVERLFEPAQIGTLTIRNRFVRSATAETMCMPDGSITSNYTKLYRNLARGGAGLILTGHMFVEPRGRYSDRQAGIHDDRLVPSLRTFTQTIHGEGAIIFAELGHAGSQCRDPSITPVAPSAIHNPISGRTPPEASRYDIAEVIASYGRAARRVRESGFDGVHIHAGHGYLISEFSSPHANHRSDEWGGDAERRGRFVMAAYRAVRMSVGSDFPVTLKLGMADSGPDGGLTLDESLTRAEALEAAGVDAIEVSVGIMHHVTSSAAQFVGVTLRRALQDMVVHRLIYPAAEQGYFVSAARTLKQQLKNIPVILVGGVRTTEFMAKVIEDGHADFVSMARPFIREPDLPNQIKSGRRGMVDCVSCNICIDHDGLDELKCWRVRKRDLFEHLLFRIGNAIHPHH